MSDDITSDDARYALEIVERVCTEVGPGVPGSPQERARAAVIQEELASHLGAGDVAVEGFVLAPGAFLGALPFSALCLLVAALLNLSMGRFAGIPPWLTAAAALVFSLLAVVTFVLEYLLYFEFVDPLFRKKQSVNVIGTLRRPGTRDAKRLLIVSGHHDSTWEFTWIRFLGYGLYVTVPTVMIGLLAMLVMGVLQLSGAIAGRDALIRAGTLGWVLLAYPMVPAIVFGLFYNRGRRKGGTVPGAVDNLSACGLAVALCRFLVRYPSHIPADTEIRFVTFGSEEAGLRGSRRYVERHLAELRRLDARVLNIEMAAHPEITITTTDVRGVKNAPEMVQSLVTAADRAGVPYKVKPYPVGGGASDAGSFSQAGLRAATLLPFQIPQQIVAFLHQTRDRPEVLTEEPLLNVLKLAFEWVRAGGE
jgi:aminopeptidase YwaD